MYEAMVYWETVWIADQPSWSWNSLPSGEAPTSPSSRRPWHRSTAEDPLEREFDVDAIRRMKNDATHVLSGRRS